MSRRSIGLGSVVLALAGCGGDPIEPAVAPAPVAPPPSAPAAEAPAPSAPAGEPAAATSGSSEGQDPSTRMAAIVEAPDRLPGDRELDAGRQPAKLLAFIGLEPGMRVGELGAGGGYTTELLARSVGPTGKVYAQNSKFILERFAEKPWSERLARPVMANVVRVDREFSDPLPPDAKELDAVVSVLFYHDTVWMKTDRDAMNRAVFEALKPGGVYVVADHTARAGAGVSESETLHRIEEGAVRQEVERAGFKLQ